MRVLGIDPGSNFMGLGCVEARGNSFLWIGHRVVRVAPGKERALHDRFRSIHEAMLEVLELWQPQCVAAEEVFFAKNPQSALKLGQARGAALVGPAHRGLSIFEYPATLVKQTVAGSGRAEKEQVQRMVRVLLGAGAKSPLEFEREDASDALAVAICHLQHRHRSDFLNAQGRASVSPAKGANPR